MVGDILTLNGDALRASLRKLQALSSLSVETHSGNRLVSVLAHGNALYDVMVPKRLAGHFRREMWWCKGRCACYATFSRRRARLRSWRLRSGWARMWTGPASGSAPLAPSSSLAVLPAPEELWTGPGKCLEVRRRLVGVGAPRCRSRTSTVRVQRSTPYHESTKRVTTPWWNRTHTTPVRGRPA